MTPFPIPGISLPFSPTARGGESLFRGGLGGPKETHMEHIAALIALVAFWAVVLAVVFELAGRSWS